MCPIILLLKNNLNTQKKILTMSVLREKNDWGSKICEYVVF